MCGIIGFVSGKNVTEKLVSGLKRLEYRGYDSAGIALLAGGEIVIRRAEGKLENLEKLLQKQPVTGNTGIGHTRWATHGAPNEINAHPHATEKVAVVHNGIIENYRELKVELEEKGYIFQSDTDTEVIPNLITYHLNEGMKPLEAVQAMLAQVKGAFALGIIFKNEENLLIAARFGSPLAVGLGEGETCIGSDALALSGFASHIVYLEEGDIGVLSRENARFFDAKGAEVTRTVHPLSASDGSAGKEQFAHFMLKEIFEQPRVISDTLQAYSDHITGKIHLSAAGFSAKNAPGITIVACGTSFYAGHIAAYWLESVAKIPVRVDIASEFRYRAPILPKNGLALFISQSGETADTLAAMRFAKEKEQYCIAVVNVAQSTMAREADAVFPLYAGPEIGVASTKSFSSQLATLACMCIAFARDRGAISEAEETEFTLNLARIPLQMREILADLRPLQLIAKEMAEARNVLFIGRGTGYGLALEGALKLKEISYIHAEGVAAGDLKHGPIALITKDIPVVALAPSDTSFDKMASNIQEVAARKGKLLLLSDKKGVAALKSVCWRTVTLPETTLFTAPILYSLPLQLLSYYSALSLGTDVDQPRNLAKSVTVE